MFFSFIFILLLITSCQEAGDPAYRELRKRNQKGEYIYRHSEEITTIPPLEKAACTSYPWEEKFCGRLKKITKEYFRCRGSSTNPIKTDFIKGEEVRIVDCGGSQRHSLPLRDGKEFIYPILIELLNYLQAKTAKEIVITSGHRCPEHNLYVNSSPANQSSKHLIGAEVSFYIKGMEREPGLVVKLLMDYYKDSPKYKGKPDFQEFSRYEKNDVNVSIMPWFNKEIFIKLFKEQEGRDFDNCHAYPYIAIQVRYDQDKQARVSYTWEQAWKNFLRY
ncbi:hypothetical protein PHSC3_000947 [Chlamydiales bacterium STE3]|nr:hypothetical protein PHSC3_000947 [Chlamydiales bacterium STE3]